MVIYDSKLKIYICILRDVTAYGDTVEKARRNAESAMQAIRARVKREERKLPVRRFSLLPPSS